MKDAVADATANGFPPGKEFMYLQMGWTEEKVFDAWTKMPQQFILKFPAKDQGSV